MDKKPEFSYHLLRSSLKIFKKNISELNTSQYQKVESVANRTFSLESVVLSTPEASDIIIPESKLIEAIDEVANRYTDRSSFLQDLNSNGLNEDTLRSALYRELLFDSVMNRVTGKIKKVNNIDIQIFYQLHREKFTKPENREVRHILITINEEFADNDRVSAFKRATEIAEDLKENPARFELLAKRYSECPTAFEGGKLGNIVRGTLYPELDAELFTMQEGNISEVIETVMGLHILYCEKINKSSIVPFSSAKTRIKMLLQERQKKACQEAWLKQLVRGEHTNTREYLNGS